MSENKRPKRINNKLNKNIIDDNYFLQNEIAEYKRSIQQLKRIIEDKNDKIKRLEEEINVLLTEIGRVQVDCALSKSKLISEIDSYKELSKKLSKLVFEYDQLN